MRLPITLYLMAALLGLAGSPSHADEINDFSLEPTRACKRPPKAPPAKLLNQRFKDEINEQGATHSNAPFLEKNDINGDGWCDWVSPNGWAPHRFEEVPSVENFIYLGSKTGWRKFGDLKKFHKDMDGREESENWMGPGTEVSYFIEPIFLYSTTNVAPYILSTQLNEDIIPVIMDDVSVYRWDITYDMPLKVSDEERKMVITFVRKATCSTRNKYADKSHFTIRAICVGQTSKCESWKTCPDR